MSMGMAIRLRESSFPSSQPCKWNRKKLLGGLAKKAAPPSGGLSERKDVGMAFFRPDDV